MPRRLVAVLVCAGLLAACSGDDEGEGRRDDAPAPEEESDGLEDLTPLEVELERAGEAPRRVLAQRIQAESRWEGDLEFTLTIVGLGDIEAEGPGSLMAREVTTDGAVTTDLRFLGLDIGLGSPGQVQLVTDALDLTGVLVVAPDRSVRSATTETRAVSTVSELVENLAAQLDPRLSTIMLPFPAQPIGEGAEWTIHGPLPLFGAATDLAAEARLVSRDGSRFEIVLAVDIATPDPGDGNSIELAGSGRFEGDLTSLGPRAGVFDLSGSLVAPDRGPEALPIRLLMTIDER